MERTAGAGLITVVRTLAELLKGSRSVCAEAAVTTFSMTPAVEGVTRKVAARPALGASEPTLMLMPPPINENEPELVLLETRVTPGGRLSVSTTPVAVSGPTLVRVML